MASSGQENAEKMTGYDLKELIGKDVAEVDVKVTEPGDAGKTAAAIETALKGKIRLKRNKGTEIYVEFKKKMSTLRRGG